MQFYMRERYNKVSFQLIFDQSLYPLHMFNKLQKISTFTFVIERTFDNVCILFISNCEKRRFSLLNEWWSGIENSFDFDSLWDSLKSSIQLQLCQYYLQWNEVKSTAVDCKDKCLSCSVVGYVMWCWVRRRMENVEWKKNMTAVGAHLMRKKKVESERQVTFGICRMKWKCSQR